MEYRTLGASGIEVSTFSLGALMFGGRNNPDHDAGIAMIHRGLDAGINVIDTADVYSSGESEEIVGKALRGVRREDVVVATKVHGDMGPAAYGGRLRQGNSRRWIMQAIDDSLRRLDLDHVDLYQLHRHDPRTDLAETLGALTDLVRMGKVRAIGCSTFPAHTIVESHAVSDRRNLERFVSEQAPYSILVRHVERDVLPVVAEHGMGAIVWSPLAGGWLTGKYQRGESPPAGSRADRMGGSDHPVASRYDVSSAANAPKMDAVERLRPIAEAAGTSLTRLANAWVLHHPAVTSAIIGPRTIEQLDDVLAGQDLRLDDDTLDAIDAVVAPGTTLTEADRGWAPPWMEPAARRRPVRPGGTVGSGR
ncbi:aldo/keto reductase [Salsipaludibacter albus]|uniref:aldo/keto reductase n=1 Tax=Salsipaludibacter albus TaxID=2849650 RepID=UPI001EE3D2A4|nr:aldo/keto reductase [Salsipaludibacter albus]MBY5162732.1 aldo/keto reductase [Salsipaludibacter albus]